MTREQDMKTIKVLIKIKYWILLDLPDAVGRHAEAF